MGMVSLEEALAGSKAQPQPGWFLRPDAALGHLEAASFDAEGVARLRHGQSARSLGDSPRGARRVRLYGPGEEFLGLGEVLPDGRLQPRRLLQQPGA
jgi:tRNA pseudouridine55 synthase